MTPFEIADKANNGEVSALSAYIQLKRLEAETADAMALVKDQAIEEASRYGKGEHEVDGAVIQCRAGAGRWDYSSLGWYQAIDAKRKALAEQAKDHEEQAQAAQRAAERMQTIVDGDGVVIEPAVYVPGKDTVAISLKKALKRKTA
jgi:hypothetical protein